MKMFHFRTLALAASAAVSVVAEDVAIVEHRQNDDPFGRTANANKGETVEDVGAASKNDPMDNLRGIRDNMAKKLAKTDFQNATKEEIYDFYNTNINNLQQSFV